MNPLYHQLKKKTLFFPLLFSLLFITLFAYADTISFLTDSNVFLWTLIICALLLIPIFYVIYIFIELLLTTVTTLETFINILLIISNKFVAFCIFIEEKATKKTSKYRDYLKKS